MAFFDMFKKAKGETIYSPMDGDLILLEEVSDPVFSQKIVGDGIAIVPNVGKIYSPIGGKLVNLFETKHAFCVISPDGLEVLVHIGLDTVNLKGKHFSFTVNQDDELSQGQEIGYVDLDGLKADGYDITTMIVITNTSDYKEIKPATLAAVTHKNEILTVSK